MSNNTAQIPAVTQVPIVDAEPLTKEQFKKVLPKNVSLPDSTMDQINNLLLDPELCQNYRENLLSYTSVIADGKFKLTDYLNAVRYVSHKLLGCTNVDAYTKTFPDRHKKLVMNGADSKTISSYVSAYHKNKLVQNIFEQTMIPVHVLNMDIFQKAINVQAEIMVSAGSDKVRSEAADSLLRHLKPPETKQVELNVKHEQGGAIDALRKATEDLVEVQRKQITTGQMDANDVAGSKIVTIEGESENVGSE